MNTIQELWNENKDDSFGVIIARQEYSGDFKVLFNGKVGNIPEDLFDYRIINFHPLQKCNYFTFYVRKGDKDDKRG